MVAVLLVVDAPSDGGANSTITPEGTPSAVSDTVPTKDPVREIVNDVDDDAPRAAVPLAALAESVMPAAAGGGVVSLPPPLHATRRQLRPSERRIRRITVLVGGA